MNAGDFLSASIGFHSDLVRNIPGSRHLQHLFDDLVSLLRQYPHLGVAPRATCPWMRSHVGEVEVER